MTSFSELAERAIDETRIGGDPEKGLVFAVVALGVAVRETANDSGIGDVARGLQSVADAIEMSR